MHFCKRESLCHTDRYIDSRLQNVTQTYTHRITSVHPPHCCGGSAMARRGGPCGHWEPGQPPLSAPFVGSQKWKLLCQTAFAPLSTTVNPWSGSLPPGSPGFPVLSEELAAAPMWALGVLHCPCPYGRRQVRGESKGQSWMDREGKVAQRLVPYCPLTGTSLLVLQFQNALKWFWNSLA